ncbi:MAG: DUF349 domain-containing protein [Bacteroidia bacterium]|nr:DUF349 domain-containing protein [Bacteroidia bacterium]
MLFDNETPEIHNEAAGNEESLNPQAVTPDHVGETLPGDPEVSESPMVTESPSAEDITEAATQEETPATPAEEPVLAEATEVVTPDAEPDTQPEEVIPPAPEAEQQAPAVPGDGLPPLGEGLTDRMEELLANTEAPQQTLPNASLTDLIHLVEQYEKADDILAQARRVAMLKRTFDVLKHLPEFDATLGERFIGALARYNKRRTELQKQADDARRDNTRLKKELIDKLQIVVDTEDPMRIAEVREIQDNWKRIGQVVKEEIEPLYTKYRFLLDKFYKLREMHFEMLEYDRKHNLQEKERLILDIVKLQPEEAEQEDADVWKERMDLLTEMQQQWKSLGHVPKDDMERINEAYRAAVDAFFENRKVFLEKQDQSRAENAAKKQEILAQMTEFADFQAQRPKDWNDATEKLRLLQEAWKEAGQAPASINGELWSKYREICNAFFASKSKFFEDFDKVRNENLAKKRDLCEKAEELIKNAAANWEKNSREVQRLQKEWKEIGPVPERHSNKLWTRFREACDAFFELRRTHYKELHSEEDQNLEAKRALIAEVSALIADENADPDESIAKIKEIQQRWKETGKVPYKEKEVIWEQFRKEVDLFFEGLSAKREQNRTSFGGGGGGSSFSGGGGGGGNTRRKDRDRGGDRDRGERENRRERSSGGGGGYQERDRESDEITDDPDGLKARVQRLRKRIQASQETIEQYSNNILRIAKGKSGDALRDQIQKEIERENKQIAELKDEIKKLNEQIKNQPKPEPPAVEAPAADPADESAAEA